MSEPYRLKVHHLEVCNCNHGCGCQFGGFPDFGTCEAIIGIEVIEGNYGAIDLAGLQVVIAVNWPKAIHEGNGTAVMFVDESASDEQVDGLAMIYSGQAGGMPWEAIGGTISSLEGPIRKKIEMQVDGSESGIGIADVLEVKMAALEDPMTGEKKNVHVVYPDGGFVWDDGKIGTTKVMSVDFGGIQFEHPGQFAAYAVTEWTNQA